MEASARTPRLTATRRRDARVTALELFFDLVFVLALTQCTALMAQDPTWQGLVRAMLVLAVLWWSWGGYAWLTSVVDPEEGAVRIAMFVAMAAFLVAALSVPGAFGDDAFAFACAYGIVRIAHIWLFTLSSRDDPDLRRSVLGLAVGTGDRRHPAARGLGHRRLRPGRSVGARAADRRRPAVSLLRGGLAAVTSHFAERHGLIVIIALGESIVAIGVGSDAVVDGGIVLAATLGVGIAAAMWWLYFDVTVWLAEDRLARATPGREQNELARDAYSLLHFPMVAGIVLTALGLKKHAGARRRPARARARGRALGGVALYLLAHVGFKLRTSRTMSQSRLIGAVAVLLLYPLAVELPSLVAVALVLSVLCAVIVYELVRYADTRREVRSQIHDARE